MKRCTTCGEEKPLNEFHWKSKREDKKRYDCRVCANKKDRENRNKNLEAYRQHSRNYYAKNSKKIIEQQTKYQAKDPERWKKYNTQYCKNRRSGMTLYEKTLRTGKWHHRLDADTVTSLITATPNCVLCGTVFKWNAVGRIPNQQAPSFDHVDPFKSRDIASNIKIICRGCNTRKRDMDLQFLKKLITYMGVKDNESFFNVFGYRRV